MTISTDTMGRLLNRRYRAEVGKILDDPRSAGPQFDELRRQYNAAMRRVSDATLAAAEDAERSERHTAEFNQRERERNDARRMAEADRINKEWQAKHEYDNYASLEREAKKAAEARAKARGVEHAPMEEFPKTREAWEKYIHDYKKETRRIADERRKHDR